MKIRENRKDASEKDSKRSTTAIGKGGSKDFESNSFTRTYQVNNVHYNERAF